MKTEAVSKILLKLLPAGLIGAAAAALLLLLGGASSQAAFPDSADPGDDGLRPGRAKWTFSARPADKSGSPQPSTGRQLQSFALFSPQQFLTAATFFPPCDRPPAAAAFSQTFLRSIPARAGPVFADLAA